MRNKHVLFLVTVIVLTSFSYGQKFHKSKTYKLSELKNVEKKMRDGQHSTSIFLLDKNNKEISEFKISIDTYSSEYSKVEEIINTNLANIERIVKVRISECACYCDEDIYYWLITEQNKWISLPKIEQYNYEIGNTYKEYIFSKDTKNSIELVEFKEKLNTESPNKNTPSGFDIVRIYQKTIKDLKWDGEKIIKA